MSSRGTIQVQESAAQDGNVGKILHRTEDKGKEYDNIVRSRVMICEGTNNFLDLCVDEMVAFLG